MRKKIAKTTATALLLTETLEIDFVSNSFICIPQCRHTTAFLLIGSPHSGKNISYSFFDFYSSFIFYIISLTIFDFNILTIAKLC